MTNVEIFINGIKQTPFFDEYIDKLFVTEEVPEVVFYTLKKSCNHSKIGVVLTNFADLDIGFSDLQTVGEGEMDFSRLKEV